MSAIVEHPEILAARLFVHADTRHDKHAIMSKPSVTDEHVLATDGKRGIRLRRPADVEPAPTPGFPGLLAVMASWEKAPIFVETTRSALADRLASVLEWRADKADCDSDECDGGTVPCACKDCGTRHGANCKACGGTGKHPTKMRRFASPETVFVVAAPASVEILRGGMRWESPPAPAEPIKTWIQLDAYFLADAVEALTILGVEAITLRSHGAGGALVIEWPSGAVVIMGICKS